MRTRGLGPLGSRGIASDRAASNVSVTATVLDMAELDAQALAGAAKRGEADPNDARAELLTRDVKQVPAPDSVAARWARRKLKDL